MRYVGVYMPALDLVGLQHEEYCWRAPFALSGGQRRRVALAGILSMSPSVMILDEPSVGLDAEGRAEFYMYLRRVQREQHVTIILVSHDMAEVVMLAEWLFVLHRGQLVLQGSPRTVFTQTKCLRSWNLAVPPLHELLHTLRQQGITIPSDILMLDEALAFLTGGVCI